MQHTATKEKDPALWCALIALMFLALSLHRLGLPSKPYFDEVHYLTAARQLLDLVPANREHPMFGKEILAAAMALLGDRPLAWRLPAALFGSLGLFAFGRLIWFASGRAFATLAAMALLATGFAWFVQSRIAMLDIFMASLALVALWQFSAALAGPPAQARWRLALCGLGLGLAMGAKWSAVPVAMAPGLAFLALRLTGSTALPRISLGEAALWLGVVPLLAYWITFAPAFFYAPDNGQVGPFDFIEQHREMIALQGNVLGPHPYQSVWWEWLINRRPIWYLYEVVDGAQRGVLLLGNPFTMLAGLPALAWSGWAAVRDGRRDALAFLLLYGLSLGLWPFADKPVQFFYHYLLPGTFMLAGLALALDALWQKGGAWKAPPLAALALSGALFAWFYPILSAAELPEGSMAFQEWMWLESWR